MRIFQEPPRKSWLRLLPLPLERMFGRIAGITEMTSSSSLGSTEHHDPVRLESQHRCRCTLDVQAGLNAARGLLPVMPSNPNYRKANPANAPILTLAMTSEVIERSEMYAKHRGFNYRSRHWLQVPGVGQVNVTGSSKPAVRIQVNPGALTKYDVGWEQVQATHLAPPTPTGPRELFPMATAPGKIYTSDQLFKAADYAPLIVAYRNGAPVRLSDIGIVTDSLENRRNSGYANGKPSILINITKQPDANIIDTVNRIYDLLPQLKASIPPSIHLDILVDRTTTIRASIEDIEYTILLSIALVVLVVFIFLRNVWATIIPSISVPLSLCGTFGVMYILGYSIDNLSLMALAISTGFVVDDAIVVMENITRYLEQGYAPAHAA